MKTMLKVLCLAMALTLCAVGMVSCQKTNYAADNTEFIIGLSAPLTGDASVYGNAVKNSAQMAVDEINAAGGLNGIKFQLVVTDDVNDPTRIATNYASLYEGGMQVSLGTVTTKPALEFKNLSADDNVFFLTPSATGDDVPTNPNGYQMCFADGNQGSVAADYVNKTCANSTIGVFYMSDDPYSRGIYDQFKANLNANVTVVEASFTKSNQTDFSSQIDTLKNCSFIFMPIYYTPASLFMTQAKAVIAPNAVYYGCDGLDGIDSIPGFDVTSIPQEISMLSHFSSKATDGKAKEFIDKYTAKHGTDTLNQFGASAYDCVYAIFGAMKAAYEKNPDSISVNMSASDLCEVLKGEFDNGYTYSGCTGDNITWGNSGYVNKTAIKYVIKEANG